MNDVIMHCDGCSSYRAWTKVIQRLPSGSYLVHFKDTPLPNSTLATCMTTAAVFGTARKKLAGGMP